MGTHHRMRASVEERDDKAEMLRGAYAAGRMGAEELAERSRTAYAATTRGELDDLTADLPALAPGARPADIAALRNIAREISCRRRVAKAMRCLLLLLAGPATGVLHGVAWAAAIAVLVALVILARRDEVQSRWPPRCRAR
jgi:DUF1707 SHOCT-like domain